MMIQTEKHGMIEPRVGDVVLVGAERQALVERKERGLWWAKNLEDGFFDVVMPAPDCTLLHRPFQVGDEVTEFSGDFGFLDRDFGFVDNDQDNQYAKEGYLIHKNPAYRDHSEYNNG